MFQQDRKGISRPVAHLHQRNEAFTIDLFPPLWSVKIAAITERGMRLDGWEAIGERYQRQAWHVVFGRSHKQNPTISACVSTTRRLGVSLTPKCNYLAHMYWRNILDVAREEQLEAVRAKPMTLPSPRLDVVEPSIDGLEVVELTVLDVSL